MHETIATCKYSRAGSEAVAGLAGAEYPQHRHLTCRFVAAGIGHNAIHLPDSRRRMAVLAGRRVGQSGIGWDFREVGRSRPESISICAVRLIQPLVVRASS